MKSCYVDHELTFYYSYLKLVPTIVDSKRH